MHILGPNLYKIEISVISLILWKLKHYMSTLDYANDGNTQRTIQDYIGSLAFVPNDQNYKEKICYFL